MKCWIFTTCLIIASLKGEVRCFEEGATIPVSLKIKGNIAEFNNVDNTLVIHKTFYMKDSPEGPLFSFDEIEWKPIMEFSTGFIQAEFDTTNISLQCALLERN